MPSKPKPNFLAQFRGEKPAIIWGLRVFAETANGRDTELMSNQDMGTFLSSVQDIRVKFPQEKITVSAFIVEQTNKGDRK
jgi:hypothetical protein